MGTTPPTALLICEHCDTVYRRRALVRGDVALCVRCDAELERHHALSVNAMLALILTAFIVFVQANMWPIVTLGLSGQHNSTTLWGMIIAMWREQAQVISVLVAFTLFFFPLGKMLTLGWLLWFARRGRRAPGFVRLMVALHHFGPWTMSEVFVLGALVAIVKAHTYFDVVADPGIYAYAALTLLITIFAGVDLRQLWDEPLESPA
ncbi:paraquat-inducible protein A [Rhodanobacter glycinis]|uniref:Paraquat-inducible protein A n=1 Tax=Rhodanobacter glycinis TaxID=582702 RepID=A0A502CAG7_9GAMM|nr:paraquat-inducible protein A [Rhodanobacter glycinis]TPG10585.1 paraquat-inducible protein A [Rhodanobacter glycinis]TPG51208.1 paraquat-inducible protein A [Rhodanobacter glycinis]